MMEYKSLNSLRRVILESLYSLHRTTGDTTFQKEDFEKELSKHQNAEPNDLLACLKYLHDKKYINFKSVIDYSGLAYYTVELKSSGIDLIEDESEFNQKFKSAGSVQIAVGNNNQLAGRDNNITMVHDIIQKAAIDEQFKSELMELVTQINNSKSHEEKKSLIKKFSDSLISSAPSLIFQIMSAIWFR